MDELSMVLITVLFLVYSIIISLIFIIGSLFFAGVNKKKKVQGEGHQPQPDKNIWMPGSGGNPRGMKPDFFEKMDEMKEKQKKGEK